MVAVHPEPWIGALITNNNNNTRTAHKNYMTALHTFTHLKKT
jgi:hypothetical protein